MRKPEYPNEGLINWVPLYWFRGGDLAHMLYPHLLVMNRWKSKPIHVITRKFTKGSNNMPRNAKKSKKQYERGDVQFIGFVNISLTDAEFAELDALPAHKGSAEFEEDLLALLDLGKLTFNYVSGNANVALTVLEGGSAGYTVSAFDADHHAATRTLRYKVHKYLDQFPSIYAGGGMKRKRG